MRQFGDTDLRGETSMRRRAFVSVVVAGALAAASAIGLAVAPGSGGAAAPPKAPARYYLSLGDSYSIGYQPGAPRGGGTAGFTAYVARKEKLTLENFGCGGATTSSLVSSVGCGDPAATDAVPYPDGTQEQAALDFITAHPGDVGLVTVSIGGNDVTSCAGTGSQTAIEACIVAADAAIVTNVTGLVSHLDAALASNGDGTAKVVGLTYPDVILGDYVYPPGATDPTLASLSVSAFDALINPALSSAYGASNFVDVTSARYKEAVKGDDTVVTPKTPAVRLAPYGKIPPNVWEVCTLTYYCSQGNIHANDKGYTFIGKLIVAHLSAA